MWLFPIEQHGIAVTQEAFHVTPIWRHLDCEYPGL
jgi:hypothetical protein